jgi:hypothetical protein
MRVNNLVEAYNVWVLKLLHGLDFTLNFLLHAEFANLVFVQDLERHMLIDSFIDSHCTREKRLGSIGSFTYISLFRRHLVPRSSRLYNCTLSVETT